MPDDGLTTRARRNAPLLAVHTGPGKGSRPRRSGWRCVPGTRVWTIAVFQFVKSAKWKVGEESAFRELGKLHEARRRRAGAVAQDGVGLVLDP